MVRVLFRARLAVSGVEVKRSMGVAACKRERQQHDETAEVQGSLYETGRELRRVGIFKNPA